ncbi:MAG TPA: nucleotide exchange factor GrpE [Candidatus Nanoarchaeia archaeon]|nr:nucleotide exchange factor GrpE [Candidatus Nanoarchaeia archaeon]
MANTKNNQENKQLEEIKKQLENKEKTLQEYTNTLQRLQADFDNYTKKVKKEKEEFEKYASARLAQRLLNIIDDFERTAEKVKATGDKGLVTGVEMVQKQMLKILEEEGIRPIEAKGQKFDPYKHEIIDIKTGNEDEVIIEEIQKGYSMHDKILRTSKVIITKKGEN